MICCISISNEIGAALINGLSTFFGLTFSSVMALIVWGIQKNYKRKQDFRKYITKLYGEGISYMNLVILRYQQYNRQIQNEECSEAKKKWNDLQNETLPFVCQAEIALSQLELASYKHPELSDTISCFVNSASKYINQLNGQQDTEESIKRIEENYNSSKEALQLLMKKYYNN